MPGRDRGRRGHIEVEGPWVDVGKHRPGTGLHHSTGRGRKGVYGNHHGFFPLNTGGHQTEVQGRRTGIDGHGVPGTGKGGHFGLEGMNLATHGDPAGAQRPQGRRLFPPAPGRLNVGDSHGVTADSTGPVRRWQARIGAPGALVPGRQEFVLCHPAREL